MLLDILSNALCARILILLYVGKCKNACYSLWHFSFQVCVLLIDSMDILILFNVGLGRCNNINANVWSISELSLLLPEVKNYTCRFLFSQF